MKNTVSSAGGKKRPVSAKIVLSVLMAVIFVLVTACASYAQVKWNPDGNPVAVYPGSDQVNQDLCPDMLGGAFITWQDNRVAGGDFDIYAQRIDSDGNMLWSAAAEVICAEAGPQNNPRLVPDGDGGAIITWEDERVAGNRNIYAQRVEADGNQLWAANGEPVCVLPGDQVRPRITTDAAGGTS